MTFALAALASLQPLPPVLADFGLAEDAAQDTDRHVAMMRHDDCGHFIGGLAHKLDMAPRLTMLYKASSLQFAFDLPIWERLNTGAA